MTAAIAINTLRLCGAVGDRRTLLAAIETAAWPEPPGQTWVFVRRLHLRATRARFRDRLDQAVHSLGREIGSIGNDSATGPEVVRFDNRVEMLAALSHDLATNQAASRWYWQPWSGLVELPPAEALTRLWQEHAAYLPALAARLHAQGRLAGLWHALSPAQAARLCESLSAHAGLDLRAPAEAVANTAERDWPGPALRQWRAAVAGLPRTDARCWLAAAVLALEVRPLALLPEPARTLASLAATLAQPGPAPAPAPPASTLAADPETRFGPGFGPGPGAGQQPARPPQIRIDTASAMPRPAARPAPGGLDKRPLAAGDPPGRSTRPAPCREPVESAPTYTAGASRDDRAAARPSDRAGVSGSAASDGFGTPQGGLFFLINALNRPEILAWLNAAGGMQRHPDGWTWLYRVGRHLGLEETGALAGFLAERIGCEDLAALPALPGEAELLHRLALLYRGTDLWRPALLAVPARVVHSPSHLDLVLPMSAVRLELRLAGLDLDPGWVVWLGRVVRFHFRQQGTGAGG